jgi:dTDP-4-dehydrorhamnose 3,5-epimerase
MSFRFEEAGLPGMVRVESTRWEDERGFFQEVYKRSAFLEGGIPGDFVQDNFSRSSRGVLRGIHFQRPPFAQGKLVWVTRGVVWDVAVDLREDSPTYGSWVGMELAGSSGRMLYLPEGFGHGYLVLSERADLAYKVTSEFRPEAEGGIRWDDPEIGVEWPLPDPLLSVKDMGLPSLSEIEPPFPATAR